MGVQPRYLHLWRVLNTDPEVSHGYDTLMSSLAILSARRPLSSIMMTSAQPEEGKTTIALNLSLTMMRSGKNILLLDADSRRPQIHKLFGLENSPGFADVLAGRVGIQDVIRTVRVSDEGSKNTQAISVVTSGVASSGSLHALGSHKAKQSIEHATKLYDLVLLDAPPILAASDALLLASMVDGIVVVLNTGQVTAKDAARAKERLEEAGGHILGVVMNRFDEKMHGPGFHPYGSYYTV